MPVYKREFLCVKVLSEIFHWIGLFFNMILLLSTEIYLDFHYKNKYTVIKTQHT